MKENYQTGAFAAGSKDGSDDGLGLDNASDSQPFSNQYVQRPNKAPLDCVNEENSINEQDFSARGQSGIKSGRV